MGIHRLTLFGSEQKPRAKTSRGRLDLPPAVKKDIFLNALLEMPTTKGTRRNPLEWAGAMAMHLAIIAALIIIPLYTTGTIHLSSYQDIPLVAPPPPPPVQPVAVVRTAAPAPVRARIKFNYNQQRLTAPKSVPKEISEQAENTAPPALGGIVGGVPGGVPGGQAGGLPGGAFGGTGAKVPAPPPPHPVKRLVRVGSLLKAPRQIYSVNPDYPALARQMRLSGVVLVDAVIDEKGNVVQAKVVSGHPLLIQAALSAVLQWKYEPTTLNGQPVSVELVVQVHFNFKQ